MPKPVIVFLLRKGLRAIRDGVYIDHTYCPSSGLYGQNKVPHTADKTGFIIYGDHWASFCP